MALSLHAPKKLTGISHSAGPVAGPSATSPMLTFRFPADGYSHSAFCLNRSGGSRLDSKQKSENCNKVRCCLGEWWTLRGIGTFRKTPSVCGCQIFTSAREIPNGFSTVKRSSVAIWQLPGA